MAGGSGCSPGGGSRGEGARLQARLLEQPSQNGQLAGRQRREWGTGIAVIEAEQANRGLEAGYCVGADQGFAQRRNQTLLSLRLLGVSPLPGLANGGGSTGRQVG